MSPKTEVIVENETPSRWSVMLATLRPNAGIILQLLTLGLVCTVLFVVLRHDAHPPGPGPTPDPEPSALHPIIAPKEVSAPIEEETAVTVKALGPVKFAASGNVIIRQNGMTAHVMPMVEGQHKILVTLDAGGWWWDRHDAAFVWVLVKTAKPPPPVPPGPVPPDPKPPVPPTPSDLGPFGGAAGLHVLIVYESEKDGGLTKGQIAAIHGKEFRDYIEAKCAKGEDGKTPQRRIWDKDTVLTWVPKLWQDAMKRPRTSVPWLAVGNGAKWFEGPLTDDFMTQVKKVAE